jgi:GntR family transcriptional regulator/MocR family aminotransferase
MSVEWAGLGPELLLRLDRASAAPLRAQIERELREAIRAGRLQPGERLPSTRALARELGISRGLALECYTQLQAEGYLTSRGGSATRVAATAQPPPAPPVGKSAPERLAIDFQPGIPDLTSFPRRDWAWAMRESCSRATVEDLAYGDPRGSLTLRTVLAGYVRRVRGASADPEQIVVCTGFAQGITLVLEALAGFGVHTVAVEDPGDLRYFDSVCRRIGMQAVPVPIDGDGIDVGALRATAARAVVLTPAHQSPTGVVLAPERRHGLVAWAEESNGTIVEDDYDAEFRYDRDPVGGLQGLAPGRVAAIGSVSKSLAPALRLGWVVCPPSLVAAVTEIKRLHDRGSPGLEQMALALLIESGRYDKHLRRMRNVYAERRDALVDSLAQHAPAVELGGLAAGFHAVARLQHALDERAVVEGARSRSVGLHGMSAYRSTGATDPPELVLGFGNLSREAIVHGVTTIADLLRA